MHADCVRFIKSLEVMTNPFLKPYTVGEWLRSSLSWTGACLGGLLLGWLVLPNVLPMALGSLVADGMPFGTVVAYLLIWRYAVQGGRAIIRHDEEHHDLSLTRVAANLWLVALTVFQLACLLGPVILLGFLLFSASPTPPAPPSNESFFG
jgi:hypothetical protein